MDNHSEQYFSYILDEIVLNNMKILLYKRGNGQVNDFWLPLEEYEEFGMGEKLTLL
jgi:hypothetical protein